MGSYSYSGRDKGGALVSSVLDGKSVDHIADLLIDRGITPIAIEKVTEPGTFEFPVFFQKKISLEELTMFARQLYSLIKAGVVLNRAIRGLAESTNNARFRKVLMEVEASLSSGVNLSTSLAKHGDVFDSMFVNIVSVGENSGRLEMAFQQLYTYLELEKDTRRRISTATRYPMFVLIALSIAIVVLNIFVIPVFADLFSQFGADLPWATKILIGTSSFFVNHWMLVFLLMATVIFGIRYYVNTTSGMLQWDWMKLRVPYIGSILERSTLSRFSRSFSMMLKSGVPLIKALELSSMSVGNSYVAKNIGGMSSGIQRGESLLRSAVQSKMFTPLVLQMLQVGEETGRVDEMLDEVAEFYEQEVDYDLKNLASYIEPLLISCIAGVVMILALGIFLPMWDMMSVMQG